MAATANLVVLVSVAVFITHIAAQHAAPLAQIVGDLQFAYDFYRDHCPALPQPGCSVSIMPGCDADVPDAPLRAWYNGTHVNVLASVDLGSRGLVGHLSAGSLRHECRLYANSTDSLNFSTFDNHEWVHSSVYFPENNTLYALTHMEYHCDTPNCIYSSKGYSYFSAIVLMSSLDGGQSWQHARTPPEHIVAVMPYQWNETLGAKHITFGFRSPSGIVRARDGSGYYYATVTANWGQNYLGQQAGACMMRTRDVTDPAGWRAWDGRAFSILLATSPYSEPAPDPALHRCVPFTNMTYATLAWSSFYHRYIMFGTNDGNDSGGWLFGLSDDLISWDSWTRVDTAPFFAGPGNATITPNGKNLTGRFVQRQHPADAQVWWEDDAHRIKRPVGSCTPCPGVSACGDALVHIPDSEFDALVPAPEFSCAPLYNTSGYSNFFYPTIMDFTTAPNSPSFDEIGQDATLFLVGQRCVNAAADGDGRLRCSPFDVNGVLVRDVVYAPLRFAQSGDRRHGP